MAIPGNLLSATAESVDPNTSGWRARLNCALSLGTGGRNGDGVLTLTSAAAGEMQAETASSAAVTVGETYWTFADAASSAQPERIGIAWLDEDGAAIGGVLWSLPTEQASIVWHRISVAGVAPAGAARARVVLSSTPAAAGGTHYFENVYLGSPMRTLGNLLSFNAESGGELDLSAWAAETNCTVIRAAPAAQWPSTFYVAGGHVVRGTATAAGDLAVQCLERPAAIEGREYLGYVYLGPPTSTADCWIEVRFYDEAGVQLSALRAYLDQTGTGMYRQRVSGTAPAGTASCGLAAGIDAASAGQALIVEGVVLQVDPVLFTGSVMPYADANFEQTVTGWSVVSGLATIARSSPWGAAATNGSYALVVSSGQGTSVLRSGRYSLGVQQDGLPWRMQYSQQVDTGSWTVRPRLRFFDDAGIVTGVYEPAAADAPTPGWWVLAAFDLAPAGSVSCELEWEVTAAGAGSRLYFDAVGLLQSLPRTVVTPRPETGSMLLTLRDLAIGRLITVWRVGPGGGRTLVRGPDGLLQRVPLTADVMYLEDYEAPLGVPVSYYVEFHDSSSGALAGWRDTESAIVDFGDPDEVWVKDPSNPHRNLRIVVERAPDWTRPIEQAVHRPRGRRNPVTLSDVRGGLVGDLVVWTRSDAEREGLHWLLDPGNTLLLQAVPGRGVADLYVSVGEVPEARMSAEAGDQWRTWALPLTEADMPRAVGVNGSAGRTWNDIHVEHATWGDVLTGYGTWEDVLLHRPNEAGT